MMKWNTCNWFINSGKLKPRVLVQFSMHNQLIIHHDRKFEISSSYFVYGINNGMTLTWFCFCWWWLHDNMDGNYSWNFTERRFTLSNCFTVIEDFPSAYQFQIINYFRHDLFVWSNRENIMLLVSIFFAPF